VPKALLRLDNRPLIERALAHLVDGGCEPVIVVLGASAERVRVEADLGGATIVVNEGWESGMGSSLISGLRALTQTGADAAIVTLVDLPGMTAAAVKRFVALSGRDALAAATYDGRRGHPVLLGQSHWEGVCATAQGDQGARDYLRAQEVRLVPCEDVANPADLDTPAAAAAHGVTVPLGEAAAHDGGGDVRGGGGHA
jgi:CTP:molybdopterin cytidylyltransferase MocA